MELNIAEQFSFTLPDNWTEYLFSQAGLQSFKFYPLILTVLGVVFLIAIAALVVSRLKRANRPLSSFFRLIGKAAIAELLIGLFIVFSRWQTLGLLSMRIFLLLWLLSLPIVFAVLLFFYIRKFQSKVAAAKEKVHLSKYLPKRKKK